MREQRFSVVVPTAGPAGPAGQPGRPEPSGVQRLVAALADSLALADRAMLDLHEIVVVDDRPGFPARPLKFPEPGPLKHHVRTVRTGGRGPAAARNAGWRSTSAPWVVFMDDDTELTGAWADELVADLEGAGPAVGALVARGADGSAVTDIAYRRELLQRIGGFDERGGTDVGELSARADRDGWLVEAGTRISNPSARPAIAGKAEQAEPSVRARLTTPLLAGAAGLAVAGLANRRFRLPALAAAAGLGAAAVLTSSSSTKVETGAWPPKLRAVLFDRDGTLVHETGDPEQVEPAETAREAIAAARRAGLKIGVVTDQPGGQTTIDQLLGPFDTWQVGPSGPATILDAARVLGIEPYECALIGDEPGDAAAAHAAGARPILVSPDDTSDGVAETAADLAAAVARLTS